MAKLHTYNVKPRPTTPAAAAAKALSRVRLCVTPQTAPVPGILQAGTLEWVAISFSNA